MSGGFDESFANFQDTCECQSNSQNKTSLEIEGAVLGHLFQYCRCYEKLDNVNNA